MTGDTIPTLDALSHAPEPAWLWDAERLRMVWANRGAIAMWGGETLFDLIDRRFSTAESGVERLDDLFKQLGPGQWADAQLAFAGAGQSLPFACRCYAHKLSDGRPGLLVVAADPVGGAQELEPDLAHRALDALPSPVVITDRAGQLVFCNAAARSLWAHRLPSGLADIVGDDAASDALLGRAGAAGIVSEVCALATRYGTRDHRMHLEALPADEGVEQRFLALFDDVADRRELEQDLRDHVERLSDFVAAAATLTWQLDADLRFTAADGDGTTDFIGQSWADVTAAWGSTPAAGSPRPWRTGMRGGPK